MRGRSSQTDKEDTQDRLGNKMRHLKGISKVYHVRTCLIQNTVCNLAKRFRSQADREFVWEDGCVVNLCVFVWENGCVDVDVARYLQPLQMSVGIWTALQEQFTLFLKLGSSTNSSFIEQGFSIRFSSPSPSSVCTERHIQRKKHTVNDISTVQEEMQTDEHKQISAPQSHKQTGTHSQRIECTGTRTYSHAHIHRSTHAHSWIKLQKHQLHCFLGWVWICLLFFASSQSNSGYQSRHKTVRINQCPRWLSQTH